MLVHEGHAQAMRFFTPANANSYDLILRLATFGQDRAWKNEIIRTVVNCSQILELACGTGILSSMLEERGKSIFGIDLTFEYLLALKRKVKAPIVQGTAEFLPYCDKLFDGVVSSYLAKYVDIQKVIDECWRVLRPGGIIVFHDFTYPRGVVRNLWNVHFDLLRLAGRFVAPWEVVFNQLDDVIKKSDWVDQTIAALKKRQFHNVNWNWYTGGTSALVSAEKP
ncbi:MAG: methyltransferase domain-containing protein [Thermoproteota archaeon]|nr:methyltransferase domain-containing protein [Thermoproteota archaeon]